MTIRPHKTSPKPTSVDTLTLQPSISSIDRFGNQISELPEMEDQKHYTLMTLLGHENKETLEDVN